MGEVQTKRDNRIKAYEANLKAKREKLVLHHEPETSTKIFIYAKE